MDCVYFIQLGQDSDRCGFFWTW